MRNELVLSHYYSYNAASATKAVSTEKDHGLSIALRLCRGGSGPCHNLHQWDVGMLVTRQLVNRID